MELELPLYGLTHTRPILGYGNFSYEEQAIDANPMIDLRIAKRKRDLWRDVADKDLLIHGTRLEQLRSLALLKDKTIFAYNYFKFDNKPFKTRWYQDCLLSDDYDRILFASSNQSGKSLTLDLDAGIEFLKDHEKNWVGILVSSSLPQSEYQMDRIKLLLKSAKIDYKEEETIDTKTNKKDNATRISYTFYAEDEKTPLYTNFLICCPHTSSALGYPANEIWLDEFDFWENMDQKHFVYQVIIPRTFETKGRIKIFTNPNGKDRLLYELWNQKDEDGNFVWHRYNFNYWDTPGANQADFDRKKIGMTRQQIDSTLLARFAQSEGAFLSHEEIMDQIDNELSQKGDQAGYGRETAWFLDVGSVHDQSTLIGGYITENKEEPDLPFINAFYVHKYPVGYPLARVVGITPKEEDGWAEEAADNPSVKETLEEYSEEIEGEKYLPLFGCDVTGNAGIIPLFNTIDIDPVDITFTGQLKWKMYQRYQAYTQQRYFKRAKDRDSNMVRGSDFSYQASKLVIRKGTKTSYRQIHHENEDDLDDTQDAVVGMIHLIENPDLPSLSYDIINDGKSVKDEAEKETEEHNKLEKEQEDARLKGQYVPSWMDRGELSSWMDNKEREYH